jgi:hypothetical protein
MRHRIELGRLPRAGQKAWGTLTNAGSRPDFRAPEKDRILKIIRLPALLPTGVGVEVVISDRNMPLIGNMGHHPGGELQVVHPLRLSCVFPIPVVDLPSI